MNGHRNHFTGREVETRTMNQPQLARVCPGPVTFGTLVLCLLIAAPAHAAWYQVEVIVFENVNPDADGEVWIENPGLPDRSYSIDLVTGPADGATRADETRLIPYLALDASRYRMDGVFRTLKLTRDYRPLLHVAWQQPGEGSAAERAVHLQQLRNPGAAPATDAGLYVAADAILDGIVQLRIGRFLHVALDMAYFPRPASTQAPVVAGAPESAAYMRMQTRRKILLNDLNYFDHPLFGVLVQVSRLQLPDVERTAESGL